MCGKIVRRKSTMFRHRGKRDSKEKVANDLGSRGKISEKGSEEKRRMPFH